MFLLVQAAQESKQNFCIFKKWYQNKTKWLQIAPGFSKDKTKLLVVPKKIWKRIGTKAFGPNFSSTDRKRFASVQNFVSKTNIFDLFWNKSSKTKAFDLERILVWHCYSGCTATVRMTKNFASGPTATVRMTKNFASGRTATVRITKNFASGRTATVRMKRMTCC
jgi:hypothetical protein